MDTVSRLFHLIRVRGTAYFSKSLAPPWGIEVPAHERLCRFHLVVGGATWITVPETGKRATLGAGDFVIVPHGRAHVLADRPERPVTVREAIPGPGAPQRGPLQVGSSDTGETILMCGYFRYAAGSPLALITHLPDLLVARDADSAYVEPVSAIAKSELDRQRPGADLVLDRLTEILFVRAVGDWASRAILSDGVLSALADERLQRVIAAIHDSPLEPWTVESLARLAGQSRTAFATAFRSATGFSPIDYLSQWRIELARRFLAETNLALSEIAQRTGYADPNTLTRAFTRVAGLSPSAFRRSAQA